MSLHILLAQKEGIKKSNPTYHMGIEELLAVSTTPLSPYDVKTCRLD
jgi:hypothetical protein